MSSSFETRSSNLQQHLKAEFERRKKKNPRYSVRSFARDLEIDPTALSRILAGTREMGPKTAKKVLSHLRLDTLTRETLLRSLIAPEDHGVPLDQEYLELTSEQLERMDDWIYSAILEVTRSRSLRLDCPALAAYFGVSIAEAESRVARLLETGLLKRTERGFRMVHNHSTTPFRKDSAALGKIMAGYIRKSIEALEKPGPAEEQDISGVTVLVSRSKLPEASRRIKAFRRSLAHFLETDRGDDLYRLNIQLVPLKKR